MPVMNRFCIDGTHHNTHALSNFVCIVHYVVTILCICSNLLMPFPHVGLSPNCIGRKVVDYFGLFFNLP